MTCYSEQSSRIYMPREITNSYVGFEQFISLYNKALAHTNQTICFDFANTSWFDANLTAVLGALFVELLNNKNTIKIANVKSDIKRIFQKNGFLNEFGLEKAIDTYDTTIQFKIFNQSNKTEFQYYISHHLLPKLTIKMSEEFKYLFASNLEEIFQNARTHGNSKHIFTCGQWFPRMGTIKFTIVDIGVTILENVRKIEPDFLAHEAISWATQYGTSTKPNSESGGLGLHHLRQFITNNKGKMHIISGDGYWGCYNTKHAPSQQLLSSKFKGTVVNLEINLGDENTYYSLEELDIIKKSSKLDIIKDFF